MGSHQTQYQRNQNRLEAYLSRHCPELNELLTLGSVALESLIIKYGSAKEVSEHASAASNLLTQSSRKMLAQDKIAQVVNSASVTLGAPCIEAERVYLQALAQEMRHSRTECKRTKKALEMIIDNLKEKSSGRFVGQLKITKRGCGNYPKPCGMWPEGKHLMQINCLA